MRGNVFERLARDAWGHGYAFEAARAARNYGRDALGLTELICLNRPDNTRSIALAQRLGAVLGETIEFMEQACLVYRHPEPCLGAAGRDRGQSGRRL